MIRERFNNIPKQYSGYRNIMTKTQAKTESKKPQAGEITFSITRESPPEIVRAGRASKYAPLYQKAKSLGNDERIVFPIGKYSQVQAFKSCITEMGLEVLVRRNKENSTQLEAWIQHPTPESKS